MRRSTVRSLMAVACVLFATGEIWAQLPRTMSCQGVLADASGTFVPDGNHTLTLALYDAATGGVVLFTETQNVPVVRGVFNSILGSATAGGIPPTVTFDRAYFLGISVDGGAELVPRTPLTASPYALRASLADAVAANGITTGAVADLAITNAKIADSTITPGKIATTGASAGQALIFNGSALAYGNALQLPYSASVSSSSALIGLTNGGTGAGLSATSTGGNGVIGITQNVSAVGVFGQNTFGEAVVGRTSGTSGVGAVVGRNDSSGSGVRGFSTADGYGVLGQAGISLSTGIAGVFENVNPGNTNSALIARTNSQVAPLLVDQTNPGSAGDLAVFRKNSVNKARIDWTGKGFFDGGTQSSGADVAEAFDTSEPASAYEPGDVLVIATTRNRTVERSTVAESTRVAGVYATKPGLLLTTRAIDAEQTGTVPMGIVGVIPTKVSGENGPIQRGDLLVTSSTPGHAMRAGAHPAAGTIIGKALEPFEGAGTGRIDVLVSIR